ncbi:hypothetical protein CDEF62S_05208 [Castellaniella defragrans]
MDASGSFERGRVAACEDTDQLHVRLLREGGEDAATQITVAGDADADDRGSHGNSFSEG